MQVGYEEGFECNWLPLLPVKKHTHILSTFTTLFLSYSVINHRHFIKKGQMSNDGGRI